MTAAGPVQVENPDVANWSSCRYVLCTASRYTTFRDALRAEIKRVPLCERGNRPRVCLQERGTNA